ncbi:hypothetical protein ACEU59_09840 [Buttiauxella noackiae]|uniref:hypothetical protein n=1 Tax=Buttiauxella noackiae TaxID=82992 RepID=UPI0035A6F2E9
MINENVFLLCQNVRSALENSSKSDHSCRCSLGIADFPHGCCGDTSEILQWLLNEKLGIETVYCSGIYYSDEVKESEVSSGSSHAWLELNDTIIDITADQFNDRGFSHPDVMVSDNKIFHDMFSESTIRRKCSTKLHEGLHKTVAYLERVLPRN